VGERKRTKERERVIGKAVGNKCIFIANLGVGLSVACRFRCLQILTLLAVYVLLGIAATSSSHSW